MLAERFLVVENTGITIPQEKLQRIFEQFFWLDSARSSKGGGAGLRIAIVKEIIELHQDRIMAESSQEKNQFIIDLPE